MYRGWVIFTQWPDTKDVLIISNWHTNIIPLVNRKNKNGTKSVLYYPEMIEFYSEEMGGVDWADQMPRLYALNRKYYKRWSKPSIDFLMVHAANSWRIYKQIHKLKQYRFLDFLVPLAEALIGNRRKTSSLTRGPQSGVNFRKCRSQVNIYTTHQLKVLQKDVIHTVHREKYKPKQELYAENTRWLVVSIVLQIHL